MLYWIGASPEPRASQVADAGLPEDPEAGDAGEDPGEDAERRLGRGGPGRGTRGAGTAWRDEKSVGALAKSTRTSPPLEASKYLEQLCI